MNKIMYCMLAAASLLGANTFKSSPGDLSKYHEPLAVVSLASYDDLIDSVKLAGRLAGRPQLADGLQGMLTVVTQGRGLAGLDQSRPWGAVITGAEPKPEGYLFLPVDDFEKLKEVFEPYVARIEEVGDGILKVHGKGRRPPTYVVHKATGWMFVCDKKEGLVGIPDDPRPLLGELPDRYDVAVRANANQIPARQRNRMIAKIKERAEEDMQRRLGEDDNEYAARKILLGQLQQAIVSLVEDVEDLTFGWNLDKESGHVALEVEMTASDDSKSARILNQWASAKTRFGGFRLPHAVLSSTFVATCDTGIEAPLDELLTAVRAKAFEDIDLGDATADQAQADQAQAGKALVDGLLGVIKETIASGRVDEATSLVLKPDAATLVAARYVVSGAKVEETLNQLVEAVRKEHPDFVDHSLATDVDELHGVRLHTVTIDVPEDADNRDVAVRMLGQSLEIVVGIGEQSVYVSVGRDAMRTLKEAIERSAAERETAGPPVEVSLALSDVAKLVAEFGKGPGKQRARAALHALESATGGSDRIRLTIEPSQRGVKLRLQADEGALWMLRPPPAA